MPRKLRGISADLNLATCLELIEDDTELVIIVPVLEPAMAGHIKIPIINRY